MIKYISYVEIAVSLGTAFGPFAGGFIFNNYKYKITMYFFAASAFFGMIIGYILLPTSLNQTISQDEIDSFLKPRL